MSYYRDTYLKSGHWLSLRNARLDQSNCQCAICGEISAKNDVHHIDYAGSLWRVSVSDLRVLCRKCHNAVHEYEDSHPELMGIPAKRKWSAVFSALTDPLYLEQKRIRSERKAAHKKREAELWRPAFEACKTNHAFIPILIMCLESLKAKEDQSLKMTRLNNEPGLEKEYRNFIGIWLQNASLSERSRKKLRREIARRRNFGIKVVAYRCEETENGNVLVDIDILKKRKRIKNSRLHRYVNSDRATLCVEAPQ